MPCWLWLARLDPIGEADSIRTHQTGHERSRAVVASFSNNAICWESVPSDDPASPPVPCSELMKEILGKLMGL